MSQTPEPVSEKGFVSGRKHPREEPGTEEEEGSCDERDSKMMRWEEADEIVPDTKEIQRWVALLQKLIRGKKAMDREVN